MTSRPMPAQDSLWLSLDRPTNLLTITSVMWTAEPIDPERLRTVARERLIERYPVFRRRAVITGGLMPAAHWEDDPDFDLDRHLVVRQMPPPGTRAALQEYVAAQRSIPLDPAHPLWTLHLLQGYGSGSAVVQRYHHAISDGIRLTQVMLGILDPVDARPVTVTGGGGLRPSGHHFASRAAGLVRWAGGGRALDLAGAAASVLPRMLRPSQLIDSTVDTGVVLLNSAGSVLKLLSFSNPQSSLTGTPGVAKTAAWGEPVPLELLSRIGHATGTTVNDVCLALVAGALDRYLDQASQAGAQGGDRNAGGAGVLGGLGWMVPVNLEPFDKELPPELGNHFALVLAVLPAGIADFRQRLAEVHRRIGRIRDSYEPLITYATQRGIARSPNPLATRLSRFFTEKSVGVLTNVPGPRVPMALAGAPVEGIVGWAPCSGRQAITVCIFSYAGQVSVGFGTDRTVVPDPERLVAAFDAEVASAVSHAEQGSAVSHAEQGSAVSHAEQGSAVSHAEQRSAQAATSSVGRSTS